MAVEKSSLTDSNKRTEEGDVGASESKSFLLASKVQTWLLVGAIVLAALMWLIPRRFSSRSTQEPTYVLVPVSTGK